MRWRNDSRATDSWYPSPAGRPWFHSISLFSVDAIRIKAITVKVEVHLKLFSQIVTRINTLPVKFDYTVRNVAARAPGRAISLHQLQRFFFFLLRCTKSAFWCSENKSSTTDRSRSCSLSVLAISAIFRCLSTEIGYQKGKISVISARNTKSLNKIEKWNVSVWCFTQKIGVCQP